MLAKIAGVEAEEVKHEGHEEHKGEKNVMLATDAMEAVFEETLVEVDKEGDA